MMKINFPHPAFCGFRNYSIEFLYFYMQITSWISIVCFKKFLSPSLLVLWSPTFFKEESSFWCLYSYWLVSIKAINFFLTILLFSILWECRNRFEIIVLSKLIYLLTIYYQMFLLYLFFFLHYDKNKEFNINNILFFIVGFIGIKTTILLLLTHTF